MPAARADDPGRKPRGNCHHTKRRTRYFALLLAADPAAGRLCNRFGHAPAPDRPRSPTRTTSRPPGLAIMTIRARGPPLPARKAQ